MTSGAGTKCAICEKVNTFSAWWCPVCKRWFCPEDFNRSTMTCKGDTPSPWFHEPDSSIDGAKERERRG